MKSDKTFKVNKYITLKLEEGKTNIYINGKYFRQCKYLLLNIYPKEMNYLDEIESIDEAAEKLSHSMEKEEIVGIEPEVEFWGHCSNLQVWVENNYNTCLLKSELAFHLLEALVKAGDIKARQALKEEIVKRINSGYLPVAFYLIRVRYPKYYLTEQERSLILLKENETLKKAILSSLAEDINNRKKGEILALETLKDLIKDYKDEEAKKIYQDLIREILKLKKKDDFNYLTGKGLHLKQLLSKEELEELLYLSPIFLNIIGDDTELERRYKKIIEKLDKSEKKELIGNFLEAVNYNGDTWYVADAIDEELKYYEYGKIDKAKIQLTRELIAEKIGFEFQEMEEVEEIEEDFNAIYFEDDVKNPKKKQNSLDNVKGDSGYDLLLLQDDPATIRLLTSYFESKGFKCKGVSSGSKGLEELGNTIPKLILLDIILPDLSGYDMYKTIKSDKEWANIPVYFLTAIAANEIEKNLSDTKADGYILKPFNFSDFDVILDILNKK